MKSTQGQLHSRADEIVFDVKEKICNESFEQVVNFYNVNERKFKDFEEEIGFDIWFLNNFRTYMRFRNKNLNIGNDGPLQQKKSLKKSLVNVGENLFRFYPNSNDFQIFSKNFLRWLIP